MGVNVYIFTQNMKLDSFKKISNTLQTEKKSVMLTTHKLLANEKKFLNDIFSDLIFLSYGDLLSDSENERIDYDSYSSNMSVGQYIREVLKKKNAIIYEKLVQKYEVDNGYVCNADLGVYRLFWIEKGFTPLNVDYYHNNSGVDYQKFWVSEFEGRKLVFLGKMDRVLYRMNLEWNHSFDDYIDYINKEYIKKDKCQYLTTIHEYGNCHVPDSDEYDVRYIQDGYLPPNDSCQYLRCYPRNVSYYAWDTMSKEIFQNSGVDVSIMPFRKVLKLPYLKGNRVLKTILVATSGPGDWTAQKNRSDEDYALEAFVEIARNNPEIKIIYRCHPSWIHPEHNGTHSIERVKEYMNYTGLKNIYVSSNLPQQDMEDLCVTFKRSSLEEDMKEADLVFGEHSVSMIDGALEGIPFASYNFSRRRNLFEGITRFGFPHCESIDDIQNVIDTYNTDLFRKNYNSSVDKYNRMVEEED